MLFPISAIRGLDHVDLRVRDIVSEWTGWERLGFRITPPSFNNLEGIASCAVALSDGLYITMSGAVAQAEAHRSSVDAGVNAALLRVNDRDRAVDELRRAGLPIKDVFGFSRLVEIDGVNTTITFRLASVDVADPSNDIDEIMIIEQVTPQHIWRDAMMRHPNGAQGLHKAVLTCKQPLALQELYSRLLGPDRVQPLTGGGLTVHCGNVIVDYLPSAAKSEVLEGCRPGELHLYGALKATKADLPGGAGQIFLDTPSLETLLPPTTPIGPPETRSL